MSDELIKKNEFVIALRDHLQSKYQTEYNYTSGDGDSKAKIVDGAYCLTNKDPDELKDLSGFCFRKDLCSCPPRKESEILREIHNFSLEKNLESELDETGNTTIKLEKNKYLITSYIDGGYAGNINVNIMKLPLFSRF